MAAPVLVFAHFFGGSARSWRPLLAELGSFVCVAPDLPGFGDAPMITPSLDAYADHFDALAADRPWVAIGHSMGGKIALSVAARRPASLRALVLLDSSPPTPEPMSERERAESLASWGDRKAAEAHFAKIADNTLSPALFDECVADNLRTVSAAWAWWLDRGSRDDISAATTGLKLPALLLSGDNDRVMAPEVQRGIAAALPHAETRIVAGAGHLAPLEQPVKVAAAIRNFVDGLPT